MIDIDDNLEQITYDKVCFISIFSNDGKKLFFLLIETMVAQEKPMYLLPTGLNK